MSDPGDIPAPRLAHAFTLDIQFGSPMDVGLLATGGRRFHVPIVSGRIEGDQLRGAVVGGHGGQLLLMRSDQVGVVALSCVVRSDDDHILWLTGQGYQTGEGAGETALTLVFEVDEQGPYAWLSRTAFVARSSAGRPGIYDVATIL